MAWRRRQRESRSRPKHGNWRRHKPREDTAIVIGETEETLLTLIDRLYEAGMDATLWPRFLEGFRERLGGNACAFMSYNFRSRRGRFFSSVGFDPDNVRSYAEHYASCNIFARREDHFRWAGTIKTGQQLVPNNELVKSEFYNDWLKPQGFFHTIRGVALRAGSEVFLVPAIRPRAAGPFEDADVALYRLLMPHLQRAVQLNRLLSKLQTECDAAEDALDRLPIGVILVDCDGEPLAINRRAEGIIALGDGLTVGLGGLRATFTNDTARLRKLIAGAVRTARGGRGVEPGGALSISRPSGLRPFSVLVAPLRTTSFFLGEEDAAVAVFITDPEWHVEPDRKSLRRLYALTRAEARLTALIVQGQRLDEAAEALGVSLNTARTHLQRIFSKTGVERQAELVRLVVTGPALLDSRLGHRTAP